MADTAENGRCAMRVIWWSVSSLLIVVLQKNLSTLRQLQIAILQAQFNAKTNRSAGSTTRKTVGISLSVCIQFHLPSPTVSPPSGSRIIFTFQAIPPIDILLGCRAGKECKFFHPTEGTEKVEPPQNALVKPSGSRTQQATENASPSRPPTQSKVVARPVPKAQTQDPRSFQIGQIQRRFKPAVSELEGSTVLSFSMKPSDPDFPYEIEELECVMAVPALYPASAHANLSVKNKDIPRGFQINIERGFDAIAANAPQATLLTVMNRLDNQLETILSGQIAETIKIVRNNDRVQRNPEEPKSGPTTTNPPAEARAGPTDDQRQQARAKRQSDMRQLEARFGRLQFYAKSVDGLTYTLPLESPKRSNWPSQLQSLKTFHLVVPELYPLEPARLDLHGDSEEASAVEAAFKRRAVENQTSTLTQQVNYLSQNLTAMAVPQKQQERKQILPVPIDSVGEVPPAQKPAQDADKTHVKYIPRPPEWDAVATSDSDEDTGTDESSDEAADEEDEGDDAVAQGTETGPNTAPTERGILLSFPHLDLHGIELLELVSLNITVKCERCKDTMDIERLRNATDDSKVREQSCKKCATTFGVRFRADLVHANSVRGGYLDLDGCTVVDMLPRRVDRATCALSRAILTICSNFIPTCSECSTAYPAPGISAVRGDAAMAICRECHHRMSAYNRC